MKKILTGIGLVIFIFINNLHAQTINAGSFNLRYDNKNDGVNVWENRKQAVGELLGYHDFEIFGIQEGLFHQLQDLKNQLKDFDYIGVGRDDGKRAGEFAAIFYDTDLFELKQEGTFWLSENPQQPKPGWDAALPRVCTWGEFTDKGSGTSFYLFNVHFDHRGEKARHESTKLVLDKIEELAGNEKVILTGDFNFSQLHENYQLIQQSEKLEDAYSLASNPYVPNGTFSGFDGKRITEHRIDHIFVSNEFRVLKYGVLTDTYYGKFPSDHFPVLVELSFK